MQRIDQPSQIAAFSGSACKKVLLCIQASLLIWKVTILNRGILRMITASWLHRQFDWLSTMFYKSASVAGGQPKHALAETEPAYRRTSSGQDCLGCGW